MVTKIANFNVEEKDLDYILNMNMKNKFWSCITLNDGIYNISTYYAEKRN